MPPHDIYARTSSKHLEAALRSVHEGRAEFVDYVPPENIKLKPPPKYKLWILIFIMVYFAAWFAEQAGYAIWLETVLRLRPPFALLIMFATIVFGLVFGALDFVVFVCRIKIGDEWYGVERWLRQPRIEWVHAYTNFFAVCLASIVTIFEDGFAIFDVPDTSSDYKAKQYQADIEGDSTYDYMNDVVLRIEAHVQPDKIQEYEAWRKMIIRLGCHSRPGMKNVETCEDPEDGIFITYITFDSIDSLNEFMTSPVRRRLVKQIQPILISPSLIQRLQERKLPDAFTDLANCPGQTVPTLQQKKWKVWLLTTLALWFTAFFTSATLPHYWSAWGVTERHPRAQAAIGVAVDTFLNSYVMTPFICMIFHHWLRRKENEVDQDEPWRTLNDGFASIWAKFAVTLALYGSLGIVWALKASA